MEPEEIRNSLQRVDDDLDEGRDLIRRQRHLVAKIEAERHDASLARGFLDALLRAHDLRSARRELLQRELRRSLI